VLLQLVLSLVMLLLLLYAAAIAGYTPISCALTVSLDGKKPLIPGIAGFFFTF